MNLTDTLAGSTSETSEIRDKIKSLRPSPTIGNYKEGDAEARYLHKVIGDAYGDKQFGKLEEELDEALTEAQSLTDSYAYDTEYTDEDRAHIIFNLTMEMADVFNVWLSIINSEKYKYLIPLFDAAMDMKLERQLYREYTGALNAGSEL